MVALLASLLAIILVITQVRFLEEINYVLLVVGGIVTVMSTIVLCSIGHGRIINETDWNRKQSKRLEAAEVPPTMTTTMKTMEHHHGHHHPHHHDGNNLSCDNNSCSSNRKLPARRNNRVGCCLMMHCGYTYRCCCCSWWVFGFGSSDRLSRCCWEPLW